MSELKEFNTEKAKTQLRKGTLDFLVLLIISQGKAYASTIISTLKENDMIVVEGTLYPLLSRLKKNGLLGYEWEESKSGPPRKYYSLTPKGKKALSSLIMIWNDMQSSIKTLIKNYEKNN